MVADRQVCHRGGFSFWLGVSAGWHSWLWNMGLLQECHLDEPWEFAVLGVFEGPTSPFLAQVPLFACFGLVM